MRADPGGRLSELLSETDARKRDVSCYGERVRSRHRGQHLLSLSLRPWYNHHGYERRDKRADTDRTDECRALQSIPRAVREPGLSRNGTP